MGLQRGNLSIVNKSIANQKPSPIDNGRMGEWLKELQDELSLEIENEENNQQKFQEAGKRFELVSAVIPSARFSHLFLRYASINASRLKYASFEGADLNYCTISYSDLTSSNFQGAHLYHATMNHCKLTSSNFKGANLEGATFDGTDLRWSDFRGANLSDCKLKNATLFGGAYDETTILPFDSSLAEKKGMIFIHSNFDSVS